MTQKATTNGVETSSLKLTLEKKDSHYTIKGSNHSEGSFEKDRLDVRSNVNMTDSNNDTGLTENGSEIPDDITSFSLASAFLKGDGIENNEEFLTNFSFCDMPYKSENNGPGNNMDDMSNSSFLMSENQPVKSENNGPENNMDDMSNSSFLMSENQPVKSNDNGTDKNINDTSNSNFLISGNPPKPMDESSNASLTDNHNKTMDDESSNTSFTENYCKPMDEASNASSTENYNLNDDNEARESNILSKTEPVKAPPMKETNDKPKEKSSPPSPPVVIKKEKNENGEFVEPPPPDKPKPGNATNDGKKRSPENGESSHKNAVDDDDDNWDARTEVAPQDETPPNVPADQGDDDSNWDAQTEVAPQDETPPAPSHPVISVRKAEDLMMSRAQINGGNDESCPVCRERFSSPGALEQHRSVAGHYTCTMSEECSGAVFQSAQDLSQHQAVHHQPPVQQLAQQVQRIPAQFQSPTYRSAPAPPPQQRNVYMQSPPMSGTQQIGSGVVLSPVASPSVPNLPPGIQLSKRPAAPPAEAPSPKQRREEESRPNIRLPDSITLVSRTPPQPTPQQRRADSVTDMLANRGITVVPSGRSPNPPPASSTSAIPRSLMNTSAISITPSSQQQQQQSHRQSNFAVPAPKPVSRLLTVDLTKESDAPPRRALSRGGRLRGPTGRSICQICDKAFPTPQELSQHMACHRGGGNTTSKLAYECRECTAQYPTEAGLQAHRQKYHGAGGPSPDMAIPVVDLKQVGVLSRLAALGIRSVIPLSQLHSGSGGGLFGLPVVAVDSASNPAICNIGGLGASNLLPLGPLKNLSFNNTMR